MATYWDIINRNDLTPEQKAQEIQAIGELERKQIYVEELQNKKKRLNTKTMWKEKN